MGPLVNSGTIEDADLSEGFAYVVALPAPLVGAAAAYDYDVILRFSGLSPGHEIRVREVRGVAEDIDVQPGNGATADEVHYATTIEPGTDPATISVDEAAGGSDDVTIEFEVYRSTPPAAAYYATEELARNTAGRDNWEQEANLDGVLAGADPAVVALALANADTLIDGIAYEEGVTAAGTAPHYVATNDYPLFDNLRLWGSRWARADVRLLRGDQHGEVADNLTGTAALMPPPIQGESPFEKMKREAERRIRSLLKFKASTQTGAGALGAGTYGVAVLTSDPMFPAPWAEPLRSGSPAGKPSQGGDVVR